MTNEEIDKFIQVEVSPQTLLEQGTITFCELVRYVNRIQ